MKKYPILILIPHGGFTVPEELAEYVALRDIDLFIEADTCANEIFALDEIANARLDTHISRLLIDLDRPYRVLPPASANGVMKTETLQGKNIFKSDYFPDEIAISGMLRRYYFPFHEAVEKICETGEIGLILECHTMMPVGPRNSTDRGQPRPLFQIDHKIEINGDIVETCPAPLADELLQHLKKSFPRAEGTVSEKFIISTEPCRGYIMKKYGRKNIPMMRLSMSKALFLNEKYFSFEYLRVDELRIRELKGQVRESIENFYTTNF